MLHVSSLSFQWVNYLLISYYCAAGGFFFVSSFFKRQYELYLSRKKEETKTKHPVRVHENCLCRWMSFCLSLLFLRGDKIACLGIYLRYEERGSEYSSSELIYQISNCAGRRVIIYFRIFSLLLIYKYSYFFCLFLSSIFHLSVQVKSMPEVALAFECFSQKALCQENVFFLKDVAR